MTPSKKDKKSSKKERTKKESVNGEGSPKGNQDGKGDEDVDTPPEVHIKRSNSSNVKIPLLTRLGVLQPDWICLCLGVLPSPTPPD